MRSSSRRLILAGLALCLLIAGVVSAAASTRPDGLEHVAETLGFADTASAHAAEGSPLADYAVRGLGEGPLSGGVAGVLGVVVVAVLAFGLTRLLRRPSGR
jgi:cobalt/nickel transport protein